MKLSIYVYAVWERGESHHWDPSQTGRVARQGSNNPHAPGGIEFASPEISYASQTCQLRFLNPEGIL